MKRPEEEALMACSDSRGQQEEESPLLSQQDSADGKLGTHC